MSIITSLSRVAMAIAIVLAASSAPAPAQDSLGIAAIVNDDVVTMLDLAARVQLIAFASSLPDTPEVRQRITPQVLRALIEERLKLQEGKRLGINVSDKDIDNRLNAIAEQSGAGTTEAFIAMLGQNGIPLDTVRNQVRADVSWTRVVRRVLGPTVDISEELVDEALTRIESEMNQPAYLVSEIFLAVDGLNGEAEVGENARRLVAQLQAGANFAAVARQFSQSASADNDGEIGWVSPSEVESALRMTLETLSPGAVSDPVRGTGGFHILLLRDRRESRGATEGAKATLAQVFFALPEDAPAEQVEETKTEAQSRTQSFTSCEQMEALAAEVSPPGAQSLLPDVAFADMPADLLAIARDTPIGRAAAPIQAPGGIAVLMVCDRQGASGVPSREEVRDRLARDRLEVLARGYLRDLRRVAIIDVRL
jgi:peptidyl-prolyl cis-trans isomerase SurA